MASSTSSPRSWAIHIPSSCPKSTPLATTSAEFGASSSRRRWRRTSPGSSAPACQRRLSAEYSEAVRDAPSVSRCGGRGDEATRAATVHAERGHEDGARSNDRHVGLDETQSIAGEDRRWGGMKVINEVSRLGMRSAIFAAPACAPPMLPAQTRDSVRAAGSARLLLLIQGFQMASTPELASAVNELLSDTSAHMQIAPRRVATAPDSARAADIVQRARAALEKYSDVKVAER